MRCFHLFNNPLVDYCSIYTAQKITAHCVCVCVCVCARACESERERECVCVCVCV